MSLSLSTKKWEATAKPLAEGGGKLPLFPPERRRRSLAAAQAPLLLFPPVSPAPALSDSNPRARRTTIQDDSFTHKDSHQQRHIPQQPFPGEGWASGVPAAATPPQVCPFADGCPATAAQAHRGRGAHERALSPQDARLLGPPWPGARLLSLVLAGDVTEAKVLFARPVLLDLWPRGFFYSSPLSPPHSGSLLSAPVAEPFLPRLFPEEDPPPFHWG